MGLNDDTLSAREHADMRETLLSGVHRIKPVGAHRTQLIAGAVAVVLVAGVSVGAITTAALVGSHETQPVSSPTATPTKTNTPMASPTATPTPTPTPTSAPVTPTVAFGGDCTALLSDSEASELLGESASPFESGAHMLTDKHASAALLGGLTCWWGGESRGSLNVTIVDAASVAGHVVASYADMNCGHWGFCELGTVRDGVWVGVGLPGPGAPFRDMTDEERGNLNDELHRALEDVAGRVGPGTAVAVQRAADWWTIPECSSLEPLIESVLGVQLEVGFPGDSIPQGMFWDILVGSGMDEWCHWYQQDSEGRTTIVEVHPQPAAGAPSSAVTTAPNVAAIEIPGAQAAWIELDPNMGDTAHVAAVAGPNRITVRLSSDDPQPEIVRLTTALIEQLR